MDAISRKDNRALYGLRSFLTCTTEVLRKQLASALVISHLDYCSVVYLDVSEELHKRLQRLQNACVRYVCGVRRSKHITPHRKKLDWLDVKARRKYFMAVLTYKSLCLERPSYLATLFNKNQSITSGRAPRDIEVPGSRTDTGLNSFSAHDARLWNLLPQSIRTLSSFARFKSARCEFLRSPTLSLSLKLYR